MTPKQTDKKGSEASKLEEIALGIHTMQTKLRKITELLYECIDDKSAYDADWVDLYESDISEEYL